MVFLSPFSIFFHDLRRRHKVSQKELANLIGYKQGYISALEVGRKPPTNEDFIAKLIKGLKLDAVEQAALRQAVEESQRNYTLPDNASAEVSRMVNRLWHELENLSPAQIRIISEVAQLRDHRASSSEAAT
jgi:transcriptional regulator with XRE-family HTH domain